MIELGEKIGEGNFRECFAVKGKPEMCIKRLRPDLGFLQRLQVLVLRRRMNQEELETYNGLPGELKPYFNPILEASRDYLLTARPLDFDRSHSLPVRDYGTVANEAFWRDVELVVDLLDKHHIWFFDTFQVGTNIFVQRVSEDIWKPVIVDYKHLGWKSFPMQFNLLFDSEKRKKFYRSYYRFEQRFRSRPPR